MSAVTLDTLRADFETNRMAVGAREDTLRGLNLWEPDAVANHCLGWPVDKIASRPLMRSAVLYAVASDYGVEQDIKRAAMLWKLQRP